MQDHPGRTGDTPVDPVDTGRISTDHEGILTIRNATQDDAGRWECIATNELGVGSDVTLLEYIGTHSHSIRYR